MRSAGLRRRARESDGCGHTVAVYLGVAATSHSELSSTALVTMARPLVELHAALVSAQIQAELEVGQHVCAKQCGRVRLFSVGRRACVLTLEQQSGYKGGC